MLELRTAEAVTWGHPDKVADQISDALLDAYRRVDPLARVALETLVTGNRVVVAGEVTVHGAVHEKGLEATVRQVLNQIGYTSEWGLDADNIPVEFDIEEQSPDIARRVNTGGAGDQGTVYGYAVDENEWFLPYPLVIARQLVRRLELVRLAGAGAGLLGPDGKTQVTVAYEHGVPVALSSLIVSTQHVGPVKHVREFVEDNVVAPVIHELGEWAGTIPYSNILVNPAGEFHKGGPAADVGLTGRKIVADTYGGAAPHGGGAFSGKDATKVDRSAAYAARQAARFLVQQGYAHEALVSLSYAIGEPRPVAVTVDVPKNSELDPESLADLLQYKFRFDPLGIIDRLGLQTSDVKYLEVTRRHHFGNMMFPWERW